MKTKTVNFGDCAQIVNGFAFSSELFSTSKKGLPVVRIRDVIRGYSETYYVGEYPQSALVNNGDILIGMDGEFNIAEWHGGAALLNQRVCKIKATAGVADHSYLKHATARLLKLIEDRTPYVTVKHLSSDDLKEEQIDLPSLEEQRRIAKMLEEADQLRRTRRYALELSDSLLPAAFIEMFGSFLEHEPDARLRDVLANPLCNGFFEKNEEYGNGTPVVWVDNLYGTITIDMNGLRRARCSARDISKYQLQEGDLLFTRSSLVRSGIGQINMAPSLREPTLFECHIIRARVNRAIVNPFYVLGLFRSAYGRTHILRKAKTATMTTIGQEDLEALPCPIPPIDVQARFEPVVRGLEQAQTTMKESLRQADHLFHTLLHQVFNDTV